MDEIQKTLLAEVADLHGVPAGAYNIRSNGESIDRKSTEHIEIVGKTDKSGIDIYIKPGTKNESVFNCWCCCFRRRTLFCAKNCINSVVASKHVRTRRNAQNNVSTTLF